MTSALARTASARPRVGVTHVAGVDLGGTKVRVGIATIGGDLIAEATVPTADTGGLPGQISAEVLRLARDARVDPAAIGATGVGGAGVPNNGGTFDVAPNLHGIDETPFARDLSGELGHPVVLENDVNVAALGELAEGVGRTVDDFVVVSVGTGIGMGIVSAGRLLRGARGAAGEIGFLPIGTDPLDRRNHRRGSLEEVLAGDSLAARYSPSRPITAREVFERAAAGDREALAALDHEARWLATALVAIAAVIDPAVVVMTGGIGGREELIDGVRGWLPRLGASRLVIQASGLGSRAPVLGAVRLAVDALSAQKGE